MSKNILITRPEHDPTTLYLSTWNGKNLSQLQEYGLTIFDLHREKANRKEVESRLKKSPCRFVFLNGHGDYDKVTGHNNEVLIQAGDNEDILHAKIVYAISCRSAAKLGPQSIQAGAESYIGYAEDFIFVYEPYQLSRSTQDETAKLFLEHSTLFVNALAKGNTVGESFLRAKNNLKENFVRLLAEPNRSDSQILRFLWWDHKHFVSHGNGEAKL